MRINEAEADGRDDSEEEKDPLESCFGIIRGRPAVHDTVNDIFCGDRGGQPMRRARETEFGRTSVTHEVRLVLAFVLLKSRTKRMRERRIWAWCSAGLPV